MLEAITVSMNKEECGKRKKHPREKREGIYGRLIR